MAMPIGVYPEVALYLTLSTVRKPTKKRVVRPANTTTYIFHDLLAVKYFQLEFADEFCVMEDTQVCGLDIYLVEQWVVDRKIGTVVAAYTGNVESRVRAIKFTVEQKEARCYPVKFQEYLNELAVNHARIKTMEEPPVPSGASQTPSRRLDRQDRAGSVCGFKQDELCFVTNLASLPSNLNIVPIPLGDPLAVVTDFAINSNLKRLQCLGRLMLLISSKVLDANVDKFRQMYRISNPGIPYRFAVRELVNLVQMCLFYFDLLDAKYADGLLCNKTEEAIANWWRFIGQPHFNLMPLLRLGVLPPTTVAGIILLLLLAKMRLNMIGGCDVPKDPFDFENFMLLIGQFQKQFKLEKRRKLDLDTLTRLFTVTNARIGTPKEMAVELDLWDVPLRTQGQVYLLKKNRHYYLKELKKLTSVVKLTVQDHITAAGTKEEDLYNLKSGAKIRNKIAKLSETLNPTEVETTKLESLLKVLQGKTLQRLFFGVLKPTAADPDGLRRPHGGYYEFQLFRLRISLQANLSPNYLALDLLKYLRGLKKMGLKRNTLAEPTTTTEHPHRKEEPPARAPADAVLMALTKLVAPPGFHPLELFHRHVNRRALYPFTRGEINLNMLEQTKVDVDADARCLDTHVGLVRLKLGLDLDDYMLRHGAQMLTISKFAQDYLAKLELVIKYGLLRQLYDADWLADHCECITNANLARHYHKLNQGLLRLHAARNQMIDNKHKIVDEDLSENLAFQFSQLELTVDRMCYELRMVDKRVGEFAQLTAALEKTVAAEHNRLQTMIATLIQLDAFYACYPQAAERQQVVARLTGKPPKDLADYQLLPPPEESGWVATVVMTVYNAVAYVFQAVHFDRANMNLDRIRKLWIMLDPNRTLITRAYSLMGKRPSRNLVALAESKDRFEDADIMDDDPMAGTFGASSPEPETDTVVADSPSQVTDEDDPLYKGDFEEDTLDDNRDY